MFFVPVARDPRRLSRLLDESFARCLVAPQTGPRSPALDVADAGKAFTMKLEMPGVAKEDVKISVEGRRVEVQAHSERVDEKKEGERLVHRERAAAHYARSITLPVDLAPGEAAATLENGVLTLTLPKRGAAGATQITIN
jgi:HSP20 family protein